MDKEMSLKYKRRDQLEIENKRLKSDLKLANETIKMLQESISEAIDGIKKMRAEDGGVK